MSVASSMSVVPMQALAVRGASFKVGARTLLHPLWAHVVAGEFTAVLGPNGAGKSTLMSLLSGQRPPADGYVWLHGKDLQTYAPAALARVRALLPQDTAVAFDYTVRDVVQLGRFPHRHHPSADEAGLVQAAMLATGVAGLAGRNINTLSGGERARAQLARVLAQIWEPLPDQTARWLLLDEPTAALDLAHQHEVLRLVRQWAKSQGVGVVAVLHDPNLALRYADKALVLQGGALQVLGPVAEVLGSDTVNRVWRVSVQPVRDAGGTLQLLVA